MAGLAFTNPAFFCLYEINELGTKSNTQVLYYKVLNPGIDFSPNFQLLGLRFTDLALFFLTQN